MRGVLYSRAVFPTVFTRNELGGILSHDTAVGTVTNRM